MVNDARGGEGNQETGSSSLPKANAAPPGYGSFVGRIRSARHESRGNVDFMRRSFQETFGQVAGKWCRVTCGLLTCSLFGLILPVAEICVGAVFMNDCPINRLIPVFLMVNGIAALLLSILGCHGNVKKSTTYLRKRHRHEKLEDDDERSGPRCRVCRNFSESIMSVFLFAWLIAGTVWVVGAKGMYHDTPNSIGGLSPDPLYCHPTLVVFSYWLIVFQLVCYGAAIIFVLLLSICLCVLTCVYTGNYEERQSLASVEEGADDHDSDQKDQNDK